MAGLGGRSGAGNSQELRPRLAYPLKILEILEQIVLCCGRAVIIAQLMFPLSQR